jgi:hypothetical protein
MVALIRRDGQVSACAIDAANMPATTQTIRTDFFIDDSVTVDRSIARTIPAAQ